MRNSICAAGATLVILAPGGCGNPLEMQAPQADPLPVMEAVADWQLAHIDDRGAYDANVSHRTWHARGWIQGAFFVGLANLAERSDHPRFADAVVAHGEAQDWKLGDRPLHADDHVIGQSYLWAYGREHDPAMLAPMRASFDAILVDPPRVPLDYEIEPTEGEERPCLRRWCWCDALFMSPPTWAGLSAATGDPRYLAYANTEFWATTDYLYDPQERLYYRDSRFLDRRDEDGRKIFWSRGNGWVVGGIVNTLEMLPADHPSRPRYENLLREIAARLVMLQGEAGYWPVSLLAGDRYTVPETSGTAFFVYALAWGVNQGLLNRADFEDAIERGWAALKRAVGPNGKLGWVQQVGDAPNQVSAGDTQLYGAGAFLLAGGQVRDLRAAR